MKRLFKGISTVWFWCGVNVIGLPDYHKHELAIYKRKLEKVHKNLVVSN